MYGFKVPKSNICVDYWDDEKEPHIRFLTHAQDNRLHNISNVKDRIYMSPFSLWYLKHVRKVNLKEHVYCLTLDKRHEITGRDESGENKVFHVTLINANHCAGSVMYFFEGDFGQVLCTGDFRYTPKMFSNPILYLLKKTKSLDVLNFDNRYVAEHCTFPPNEVVVKNTVDMLKSFPEHKIMICIGEWGKLDLLQAIAKELKEKISVSKTCMMIAKRFGITDIFTLEESRISTHDSDLLSLKDLHELQSKMGPTILLVMNAFYFTSVEFSEKAIKECQDQGLHIMPYSEHSNHQELREFISALQPNFIVPVVRPSLGTSLLPAVARNSTIPESILVLQKSYRTGLSQDSVQEDSPGPALSDLLEGFGFRGFDLKEGEGPASKKKKTMCHSEEIDYPTCKLCGANEGKVEKTDRKYPKILNYWTDQSVNGNAFRHPDLEGVYDYK